MIMKPVININDVDMNLDYLNTDRFS
jgi:hypothetical protein